MVIVGKFFNKGSRVSQAWRNEHPMETEDEAEGAAERMLTAAERRELMRLDTDPMNAVCAAPGHATSIQLSIDVCWKGKPKSPCWAEQSTNMMDSFGAMFSPPK